MRTKEAFATEQKDTELTKTGTIFAGYEPTKNVEVIFAEAIRAIYPDK